MLPTAADAYLYEVDCIKRANGIQSTFCINFFVHIKHSMFVCQTDVDACNELCAAHRFRMASTAKFAQGDGAESQCTLFILDENKFLSIHSATILRQK